MDVSRNLPGAEPHAEIKQPVNIPGREVSCRTVGHGLDEVRKKGLGHEVLTAGVDYPLEHLLDENERIDWSSFHRIMSNAGAIWTDPELIEIGRTYARSRWARAFRAGSTLRPDADRPIGWGASSQLALINLLATCIRVTAREIEPNHLQVDVVMMEGYEPSRESFVVAKGWIREWPSVFGLGEAVVEMEEIEGGARYHIHIQRGETLRSRFRRKMRSLFGSGATDRELTDALELLHVRQLELEKRHTEQLATERALRESEERFRALAEASSQGVMIHDKGIILAVNEAGSRMLGYERSELIGKDALRLLAAPQSRDLIRQRFEGELGGTDEVVLVRKDGTVFEAEVEARGIRYRGRKARVVVARDITDQKRAEAERKQLETQIRQAQKLESLGVVAGGIAHDFNNLLTPILGYAGRALVELDPGSPARLSLEQIRKTAHRAAELTNELLTYAGESRVVTRVVDLSELVHEMESLLGTVNLRKATLRYDLASDLPAIEADPTQIRQVVMNLISNAAEAIGENPGAITVRTGVMEADRRYLSGTYLGAEVRQGRYVYLEVVDTGCGMDEETKAKIFDPFFTTKFSGRGLGLAALLGIVRAHRGTLRLASALGQGTNFRVLFPSRQEAMEKGDEAFEAESAWRGSGTVLVVDDEEAVRDVTRWMLEATGFSVLTAEDGREGVGLLRERRGQITAVVLDLTMPEMSGEEALHEIRRIRPDVPVLLSSGYSESIATRPFIDEKLVGFVHKPYDRSDLAQKLRELLET